MCPCYYSSSGDAIKTSRPIWAAKSIPFRLSFGPYSYKEAVPSRAAQHIRTPLRRSFQPLGYSHYHPATGTQRPADAGISYLSIRGRTATDGLS